MNRTLGNFILFCSALLVSFLLVEGLLRISEYYKYKQTQFEAYKKIYSDERDKEYVFGHKPNVLVKLEKGYYSFTFITNSDGLRETKDYKNLNKSIIFLGDSIIEGASVENDETLSSIFGKITGIASLNYGVSCYNTANEYYWLKNKYRNNYNTKLVVLGFCLNDMEDNCALSYFDDNVGNWKFYKNIDLPQKTSTYMEKYDDNIGNWKEKTLTYLKKSNAIVFIYQIYKEIFRLDKTKPVYNRDKITSRGKIYTEYYMNKINEFCKTINSDFIVVIFPAKDELIRKINQEDRLESVLIEILQKNKIEYIDLFELLRNNYIAHPEIRWFYDDIHPYKPGHALIGEYLAREIPKRFPRVFRDD